MGNIKIFMCLINLVKWVLYKQKYPCCQSPPPYVKAIYFLISQNAQFGRDILDKPKKVFLADSDFFKSIIHIFIFFWVMLNINDSVSLNAKVLFFLEFEVCRKSAKMVVLVLKKS